MYIYVYVCMCVCMYVCLYVCVYVCVCVYNTGIGVTPVGATLKGIVFHRWKYSIGKCYAEQCVCEFMCGLWVLVVRLKVCLVCCTVTVL